MVYQLLGASPVQVSPGGYGGTPAAVRSTLQVYYPLQNRAETIATDPMPAPEIAWSTAMTTATPCCGWWTSMISPVRASTFRTT